MNLLQNFHLAVI